MYFHCVWTYNKMVKILARETVEQYIRDSMEPVSYTKLIDEFTYPSTRAEVRKNIKGQLENILNAAIDSGSILQYRDHFYSPYLSEDLEGVVHFMDEENMSSVLSEMSFTSCESLDAVDSEEESSSQSSDVWLTTIGGINILSEIIYNLKQNVWHEINHIHRTALFLFYVLIGNLSNLLMVCAHLLNKLSVTLSNSFSISTYVYLIYFLWYKFKNFRAKEKFSLRDLQRHFSE